jgi:NADH-quinone oxidoreductase subunit E
MKPNVLPENKQPSSFSFSADNLPKVEDILSRYPKGFQKSAVMPLLDLAQRQIADECLEAETQQDKKPCGGWIPRAAMDEIARIIDVPAIKVYEVATFYSMYNLSPVGKYHIQCCTTTPCWLRGSSKVVAAIEKHLGIKVGQSTEDGNFTLTEVECLGACVNAPIVQINDDFFEDLDEVTTIEILRRLENNLDVKHGPQVDRLNSAPEGGATTLNDNVKKAK